MRRILILALCILMLTTTVFADSNIPTFQSSTTVTGDGSCHVSINLTLHLDSPVESLDFPIPANAVNVSLNGSSARMKNREHVRLVRLDGVAGGRTGDLPLSLQYTVPELLTLPENEENPNLILTLPLLSGFAYPITDMEFTVTLPGPVGQRPVFSSGYHQQSIESDMIFTYSGSTVSGLLKAPLKDHETLTMVLEVPREQFPQVSIRTSGVNIPKILTFVLLALAFVYWAATLRCLPVLPIRYPVAPVGITAGEVDSRLTGAPTDLTMMVLSWAQMGYILIQMEDSGRVLLHKRMEMGNERSAFENRTFRALFGRRKMVDGSGMHYAQLCRTVAKTPPRIHGLFRSQSGNPTLFRLIACLSGVTCGLVVAGALVDRGYWAVILAIFLAAAGGVSGWLIQAGCYYFHLQRGSKVLRGMMISGLWLLLGLLSGTFSLTAAWVGGMVLSGLAAAYGGRRTDLGRQNMQQILGFRRFLRTLTPQEADQIHRINPEYYYQIAPYALALGVDRAFTRRCGSALLPQCSYLVSGMTGRLSPREWMSLLRDTVEALNERYRQNSRFSGK